MTEQPGSPLADDAPGSTCPSIYPHDPSIQCERQAGHPPAFLHCHGEFAPNGPYFEWEDV